jgi:predicted transcriptional regulator
MISLSKKTVNLIFVLIVLFGIFIEMPVAAWSDDILDIKNGYVVKSGYKYNNSGGEVDEGQQIDFWEMSPRTIIFCLIYDNVPIAGEVIAILLFSTFSAGIAYSFGIKLVTRKNVLENKNRNMIYKKIEEKPGISFTEITRELKITKTMNKYHLDKLLHYELITVYSNNGRSGYFRNNDTLSADEKILYLIKKNPQDRKILGIVKNNPGVTRKEIINEIKLSGPSITWHMERLERSGLIKVVKDGRLTRYYIKAGCDIFFQNGTKFVIQ